MAVGLNSLLNIGNGALSASQSALQTTGNNIANVNTEGYSRQSVRLEAWTSLDYVPGQMGQGVKAAEVLRHFDEFVERSYLNKFSEQSRWTTMTKQMNSVESVFNESSGLGINNLLSNFYNSWEDLSQFPDDLSAREALISATKNLSQSMQTAGYTLSTIKDRVDNEIINDVEKANLLMQQIADLNRQISMHSAPGNNPNSLLDARDQKVRELAAIIDVDVINKGDGNFIVNTKAGHTLVDGTETFKLHYGDSTVFKTPKTTTTFDGSLNFNGTDGYEYTVEFVQGGTLSSNSALFKVSLDGGRTWVSDETGNPILYTAREDGDAVKVKDLEISFSHGSAGAGDTFNEGDRFTIVPKGTLYWVSPTIGPLNVTPQQTADGIDVNTRVTGGSLGGNFIFRDYQLNEIHDQFDQFAAALIWEVNRLHSQGAGLENLTSVMGDYGVGKTNVPLGADNSGLFWKDKLQEGNFTIAIYDLKGNPLMAAPGSQTALSINFNPLDASGVPPGGSLEALVNSINSGTVDWIDSSGVTHTGDPITNFLEASIVDDKLKIVAKNGFSFGVGNDTTGVLAALGINTFFSGTTASDIAVRDDVALNHNLINAGHINGAGETNAGDGQTARDIAKLADTKITFTDWTGKTKTQSIGGFYSAIVSNVGGKTANNNYQMQTTTVVANELADRQSEVSGVNLDEEMSNLIKFQSSYKAAAKLITTADQMLQTLLSLKQ